jgi:hypothetical protein
VEVDKDRFQVFETDLAERCTAQQRKRSRVRE